MDTVIDALSNIIPFSKLFAILGFSKEISEGLSVLITAMLVYLSGWLLVKIHKDWKNRKITKDLVPYFDYQKVKQSLDLFIPTRFQNYSPTTEDEPLFSHRFVSKSKLIPFFLNTAFNEKKETDKFYLILADSGMGKTTFMINLYVRYNSFFNFGKKHKIKLLPFGDNRIIDQLKEMGKKQEEAKNTILLLDAFDEDRGLLPPEIPDGFTEDERFRKRLDEIVELTRDFREVVITSRTQYFPGQENQAYELKVPSFDAKGFHTLAKLYLSPFDGKEVNRYLCKKYGYFAFWNHKKKQTALKIVEKSPNLMVRPMLLAYIDYLVDGEKTFATTYQVYETLIEKWIGREAVKRKYESTTREKFKNDLHVFSNLVAVEIYKQHKQTGNLSVSKEIATGLCKQNDLDLQDYEITGQSLLTRDISHNWKFAHKSILEFFLAKKCIEDFEFAKKFEFSGMDMAKKFYEEDGIEPITKYLPISGGKFNLENKFPVKVDDFYMSKYQVTQAEYVKITGKANPSYFIDSAKNPVEDVSWPDATNYCNMLNQKYGYKPVYDKEGNLLDTNGNITNDITKVKGFRLPTEAEWEYAAGGGDAVETLHATSLPRTEFAGTNNENELTEYAWFEKNSNNKTHPVGQKQPNQLGLHDMSGNVWEWCSDCYGDKYYEECSKAGTVENPLGPSNGSYRVVRGGSWASYAGICRVAYRSYDTPVSRSYYIGFRLVLVP